MWQEYKRVGVTARAAATTAACVYACVCFMFRLCYGLVTACEWDPRVQGRKQDAIFIINLLVVGSFKR